MPNRQSRSGSNDPGYPIREIAIAVIFFVVGLLPYIYLPLAAGTDPPVNWGNPSSFINFWHVVMRIDYGTFSFGPSSVGSTLAAGSRFQQVTFFASYFINNFTWVGIILAVLGAVWFFIKRQIELLGLGLAFLIGGPLFMILANPPLNIPLSQGVFERFYIMPSIPFAFFIAAGVAWLLELANKLTNKKASVFLPRGLVTLCLIASILGPVGLAFNRLPALDLKHDAVAEDFGRDLLAKLEPNAILIMDGDEPHMCVTYQQTVLGYRKDVVAIDFQFLATPWYMDELRRFHPEVTIPAFSPDKRTLLADFVTANLEHQAVYGAGFGHIFDELTDTFDELRSGLPVRFMKKGDVTDSYAFLRAESDYFASLHFPDKTYPDTSWEAEIGGFYSHLALEIGTSRDKHGPQPDADFVKKMYRIAILNDPGDYVAYGNLALVLWNNAGPSIEVQVLMVKYLQLAPEGAQKEAARAFLAGLQNGK